VHLELQTVDLARACTFFTRLLGWRAETVHAGGGRYVALDFMGAIEGGVVERDDAPGPSWLPYVEVPDLVKATERALELGASIVLAPREGPAGWRSSVSHPAGGELAFWQPKR
jgi:predicted enzyme related to lactoylglutathione lyase